MYNLNEDNRPGLLFVIDFEKAFDTVSKNFIRQTLKFFNFGTSIIKWFDTLYNNAFSTVLVNGYFCKTFLINRGCRQGDPLSPLLFNLVMQIRNGMIYNDTLIRGLKFGNVELEMVQYADDTMFILDSKKSSFDRLIDRLNFFSRFSGLKINLSKSFLVGIGSLKDGSNFDCLNYNIQWIRDENFKILGIIFNTTLSSMVHLNYSAEMIKIHDLLNYWSRRYLTPLGRITVIKSLILPHLNYLFSCTPLHLMSFLLNLIRCYFDLFGTTNLIALAENNLFMGIIKVD